MNCDKTNWDKIVTESELSAARNLRSKPYVAKKERTSALAELIDEGWEKYKDFKNPRFIGVKKDKKFDEVFEDRVWMMFFNLGFSTMNSDRNFVMSYCDPDKSFTQQIDVFAADDETVIIVECKAAESQKDGNFKKSLEALYGQMPGLQKETRAKFPGRKIKFIWATHNYIISRADLNKMSEWGIIHFGDAIVDYYTELAKHLGTAARYQLLGNLFANQEIKNMEETIPAIEGKMGKHTYYSFSIEPERLLKIGYVLHRNEANQSMMPTYQRLIKKKRLSEVREFINKGGYFPNSLVISIDSGGRDLTFIPGTPVKGAISKIGTLYLPKRYRSAYIIDGQHRLYGYSDSKYATNNTIPVVAFVNLDRSEQIQLFMDINANQKAVPKRLRVTLIADLLWESSDYNERRQALRSKLAQMLGEEPTSPLLDRVVVGENESSSIKCITLEAIQTALKRCQFFSQFGKNNVLSVDGTFDLGKLQETCDTFYPFIESCLKYIKTYTGDEWIKGDAENGIITINRGIQAIIRVINDIVNHLISEKELSPKTDNLGEMCRKVEYYLDPLIEYFNSITVEQRKELRGYYGAGGDPRFWRTYQKAIADQRDDFRPDGLAQYWVDEAKTFNDESLRLLREIEVSVKRIISDRLAATKGKDWLVVGLPKPIYTRAKKEADDQIYDLISSGLSSENVNLWDCVKLSECKEIMTNGKNWPDVFEQVFVMPGDEKLSGGRNAKTDWISKLSSIRNKLDRPTYSVSNDEYTLIKSIHEWLVH